MSSREDLLISLATGEIPSAEAVKLESTLTSTEREELRVLRRAFTDLKGLPVPECQLSFERIKHAIHTSPAPAPRGWQIQRWLWIAAPVAVASLIAVAVFLPRGGALTDANATGRELAGAVLAPETPRAASLSPAPDLGAVESAPLQVRVEPAAPQPAAVESPRRRVRRSVQVASHWRPPARSISKQTLGSGAGSRAQVAPDPEALAPMKEQPSVPGSAEQSPSNEAGSAPPAESVVVITTRQDDLTGAPAAIEVSKTDGVVFGG